MELFIYYILLLLLRHARGAQPSIQAVRDQLVDGCWEGWHARIGVYTIWDADDYLLMGGGGRDFGRGDCLSDDRESLDEPNIIRVNVSSR